MLSRHLTLTTLTLTLAAAISDPAHACCLTDWLYGRQAVPYAAGYAPVYSAGYAPIAPAGYSAGYAPITSLPTQAPVLTSGAFQAQRPAYTSNSFTYDNPSVYTGAPIYTGAAVGANVQTAFSVPVTSPALAPPQLSSGTLPLRGSLPLGGNQATSFYAGSSEFGAANVYPNSSYYQSNYAAAQVGLPATAVPSTNVAPLFPAAPRTPIRSGLSRFFGSLFGTNYQSSYYRAPVTYYRPVTTIDPTLGTTVTVQQPCLSTVNQLQRTPYSSLLPTGSVVGQAAPGFAPIGQPSCDVPPGSFGQVNSFGQPNAFGQANPIGQASATGQFAPGQFTVPIPSTMPPGASAATAAPNFPSTTPLTGSPASPRSQSDLSPLDPPSLQGFQQQQSETSFRDSPPAYQSPARSAEPPAPSTTEPAEESYWQLQDSDDSTAMISPSRRYGAVRNNFENRSPRQAPSFTGVRPIRALEEDEPSPFENQTPRLPASSSDDYRNRSNGYSTSSRIPVREAAMTQRSYASPRQPATQQNTATQQSTATQWRSQYQPAPKKRDNTWSVAK